MATTYTISATYTTTDIRRVLGSFGADYDMIAQATATHSPATVESIFRDLCIFAVEGYLQAISIELRDAENVIQRAATYTISTTASSWRGSEPGNNLWPRLAGAHLTVIATLVTAWWYMSDIQRQRFRERTGLQGAWGANDTDTTYSDMVRTVDRRFVSNGYGMEKALFTR